MDLSLSGTDAQAYSALLVSSYKQSSVNSRHTPHTHTRTPEAGPNSWQIMINSPLTAQSLSFYPSHI